MAEYTLLILMTGAFAACCTPLITTLAAESYFHAKERFIDRVMAKAKRGLPN